METKKPSSGSTSGILLRWRHDSPVPRIDDDDAVAALIGGVGDVSHPLG